MPIRKLNLRYLDSRCVELILIFIYPPYMHVHILNESKDENTVLL